MGIQYFLYKVWFQDGTYILTHESCMHNATITARARRLEIKNPVIISQIEDEQGNLFEIDEIIKFKSLKL